MPASRDVLTSGSGHVRRKAPSKLRITRQLPAERRQALIEATIESLKAHGHEGLSVRRIAATAGVSAGLINHHFPSIDQLIAEAYRHFSRELTASLDKATARSESPTARLRAFLQASFSPPVLQADVLTVWVVFWSLYRHSKQIRRAHKETYGRYVELVQRLLSDVMQQAGKHRLGVRLTAIGLTAMLDGLWLEWCLDPRNFSPKEAVMLCESWIQHVLLSSKLEEKARSQRGKAR